MLCGLCISKWLPVIMVYAYTQNESYLSIFAVSVYYICNAIFKNHDKMIDGKRRTIHHKICLLIFPTLKSFPQCAHTHTTTQNSFLKKSFASYVALITVISCDLCIWMFSVKYSVVLQYTVTCGHLKSQWMIWLSNFIIQLFPVEYYYLLFQSA